MKKLMKISVMLPVLMSCLLLTISVRVNAQYKARLSVEYHKIIGDRSFISVAAKFKGDDGYEPATMLPLTIYNEISDDSLALIGEITTDMKGDAQLAIDLSAFPKVDSVVKYTYVVKIEDSDKFKNAKKSVSFMDVDLKAEAIVKDSLDHISATLVDAIGNPLKGVKLSVTLERLFAPLGIGESSYKTAKDGTILVPIEEPLPGVDGILTFEVMLDSKKYGVVSYKLEAPIGVQIVDKSTFDQRTMWSPPTKTPLFLWIFPNLIILGIWGVILLLLVNLVKIYKS